MTGLTYLLIVMFVNARYGLATYDCIRHCSCEKRQGVVTADCTAANFTEVPFPEPPHQVNILELQFNFITLLRDDDFAVFGDLRRLNMSGNRLSTIQNGAFFGLDRLESLDLSSNLLTSIPDNAWRFIQDHLTWLSLSMNAFYKLPDGISNLTRLTYLDVSQLYHVSDISSVRLPASLEILDLGFTGIKRYTKSSFAHLTNLTTLILSDNSASSSQKFEPGFFDGFQSLEHLDLSRTFSRKLPRDSFSKLKKLKSLSMNNCFLRQPPLMADVGKVDQGDADTNVGSGVAPSMWFNPDLEKLDLSDNRYLVLTPNEPLFPPSLIDVRLDYTGIREIDDMAFSETEAVKTLNLSRSRLQSVSFNAFANIRNLSALDLSENMLSNFPRLPQTLRTVNLAGSQVTNISRSLLVDLRGLTWLSLAKGKIMSIDDYSFINLTLLETLDLSDNKISTLTRKTLLITNGQDDASNLKSLDLSSNIISTIDNDAFLSLYLLETLDLQMNSLGVIQQRTFAGLKRVVTLNLNSNSISVIDPNAMDHFERVESINFDDNKLEVIYAGMFSNNIHLKKLVLSRNQLVVVHPIELEGIQHFDVSYNNLTTFPEVSGASLEYVYAKSNQIQEFAPGAFEGLSRLKELDLSHCSIAQFDYTLLKDCQSLDILDLNDNSIAAFVDISLPSLRKLHLAYNEISNMSISLHGLFPLLKELDVKSNSLRYVDPGIFADTNLGYLDLSMNPYHCDCDLKPLTNWLDSNTHIVETLDMWYCMSPTEFELHEITNVVPGLNCSPQKVKSASVMIIVITAVVSCFFFAFSIYVIAVCVKSRRNAVNQQNESDDDEIHISPWLRCWLVNWCKFASHDDQRTLVPTVTTSPTQKDAPTSL